MRLRETVETFSALASHCLPEASGFFAGGVWEYPRTHLPSWGTPPHTHHRCFNGGMCELTKHNGSMKKDLFLVGPIRKVSPWRELFHALPPLNMLLSVFEMPSCSQDFPLVHLAF